MDSMNTVLPPQLRYLRDPTSSTFYSPISREDGKVEMEEKERNGGNESEKFIRENLERRHENLVKTFIKHEWLRKKMKECKKDYTRPKNLSVYVSTYNVNAKRPGIDGEIDLSELLTPSKFNKLPDVYVCGFQEMIDLTKIQQVINESVSKERAEIWIKLILNFLNHELIPSFSNSQRAEQQRRAKDIEKESKAREVKEADLLNLYEESIQESNLEKFRDASSDSETVYNSAEEEVPEAAVNERYVCVGEKHMVGIMVCVFVLRKHLSKEAFSRDEVISSVTPTGMMGFFGNKGCAAIRLKLYSNTFCFICAHLAAHRENVEQRNNDYRNIMSKTCFPLSNNISLSNVPLEEKLCDDSFQPNFDLNYDASNMNLNYSNVNSMKAITVEEHDFIIFLGDLNYRMQKNCEDDDVFAAVQSREFDFLLENDQLLLEKAKGNVFKNFSESEIRFLPTYKYVSGTNVLQIFYDNEKPQDEKPVNASTVSNINKLYSVYMNARKPKNKIRQPGYCDRILFQIRKDTNEDLGIVSEEYDCRLNLMLSDHKPVISHLNLKASETLYHKRKELFQKHVLLLDNQETVKGNTNTTSDLSIVLSSRTVDFGEVPYSETISKNLELTNNSKSPIVFRLVPKKGSHVFLDLVSSHQMQTENPHIKSILNNKFYGLFKEVYKVSTEFGLLLPNEKITLTLKCFINRANLKKICFEKHQLDDFVKIRVSNFNEASFSDYKVKVKAQLKPTVFGKSLSEMVELNLEKNLTTAEGVYIPNEVWRIFEYMVNNNCFKDPDLFVHFSPARQGEKLHLKHLKTIRHSIDENTPFPTGLTNNSLMYIFLELLSLTQEPPLKVTDDMTISELFEAKNGAGGVRKNIKNADKNTFLYFVSFCKEAMKQQNRIQNKLDPEFVSTIIVDFFIRPLTEEQKNYFVRIVYNFITKQ